jgi:hypothetical protein
MLLVSFLAPKLRQLLMLMLQAFSVSFLVSFILLQPLLILPGLSFRALLAVSSSPV